MLYDSVGTDLKLILISVPISLSIMISSEIEKWTKINQSVSFPVFSVSLGKEKFLFPFHLVWPDPWLPISMCSVTFLEHVGIHGLIEHPFANPSSLKRLNSVCFPDVPYQHINLCEMVLASSLRMYNCQGASGNVSAFFLNRSHITEHFYSHIFFPII